MIINKNFFRVIIPTTIFIISFIIVDLTLGHFYTPQVSNYRKPHYYYHHDLRSNISDAQVKWAHQIYKISTNSMGFRDSDAKIINKRKNKYRIILMGDSFTEGLGVNWEDSFAGILSDQAKNKNIQILNAGTIGYSPKIYYLKTEFLINIKKLEFDELIVFIDMSDIDNEHMYENYQPNSQNFINKLIIYASRYSFILSKVRQPPALKLNNQGIPFSDNLRKSYKIPTESRDLKNPYILKGFQLAINNMVKLNQLCLKNNISLKIIIYPWQNNIGYKKNIQEIIWKDFANQNKIEFLNLFPAFEKKCKNDGKNCFDLFIPSDPHWSKTGHKFVADKINNFILNNY